MNSSDFYKMIKLQLSHYGEGSMSRFREIFDRSFHYVYSKSPDSFARFIYCDFLIATGLIEVYSRNGVSGWAYIGDEFCFRVQNRAYILDMEESEESKKQSVTFVDSNYDIFPKATPLIGSKESPCLGFSNKLSSLKFDPEFLLKNSFSKFDFLSENELDLEYFDFEYKKWRQQIGELKKDVILRTKLQSNQKLYYVCGEKEKYKTFDSEFVFLAAMKVLNIKAEDLFQLKEKSILLPWQVKIPSVLKRLLLSESARISYTSNGILYVSSVDKSYESLFNFLKVSA